MTVPFDTVSPAGAYPLARAVRAAVSSTHGTHPEGFLLTFRGYEWVHTTCRDLVTPS
jgi:hypothetical protein